MRNTRSLGSDLTWESSGPDRTVTGRLAAWKVGERVKMTGRGDWRAADEVRAYATAAPNPKRVSVRINAMIPIVGPTPLHSAGTFSPRYKGQVYHTPRHHGGCI
jgi:hypothetical protein